MINRETLPRHWGFLPIRSIFYESDQRNDEKNYELLSVTQDRGIIKQSSDAKKDTSNDNKSKYKVVLKNSIAYNKMRMWQGAVGINEMEDGIVSPAYVVINPIAKLDTKYYFYLFKSTYMISQFGKYSYGLVDDMNSLRYEHFRSIYVPIPPLKEQNLIVKEIDKISNKTDKFINKKTEFIKVLKEQKEVILNNAITKGITNSTLHKITAVTSLNTIPSHWRFIPFKYVIKKDGLIRGPFGSALKTSFFVKKGYKVYEQKNAISDDISLGESFIDEEKYQELKRFKIKENDFLMSCSGTIGKITQVQKNFTNGVINQALLIIRIKEKEFDFNYFKILFKSHFMQTQILDNSMGSAMKNLVGMDIFKNIKIPLPPFEEQKKIVVYIEKELSRIDNIIEKTTKEIELIKEYQISFISEIVSGQLKVG